MKIWLKDIKKKLHMSYLQIEVKNPKLRRSILFLKMYSNYFKCILIAHYVQKNLD